MSAEELVELAAKNALAKRILKEAIDEWLDNKFLMFGKWTFYGGIAAVVAALGYFVLGANGWHKP